MSRVGFAILLALALCAGAPAFPQVVVEEVGVFQDQLLRAKQAFDDKDFPRAIQSLDPLVAGLSKWDASGRMQAGDEEILLEALELRALCRASGRDSAGAREDFARLVTLRPERPLSRTPAPKVRKLFDDARRELTGTALLTVEPGDADLAVDGRPLGSGYPRALPLRKGLHHLTWTRSGYEPAARQVEVEAGEEVSVDVRLIPNAKTVFFLVQPEGTELHVGKKKFAAADKSALYREDLARLCRDAGLDPAETFVIEATNMPPGEHRVTLKRDCHESKEFVVKVSVDQERSVPGYTRPVVLQRRTVRFRITSSPSGASVEIDGKPRGTTPLLLEEFCVGEHDFRLAKQGAGEYRTTLALSESGPYELAAKLRPTLLWVGLTRDQEAGADLTRATDEVLRGALGRLERFNCALSQEANPLLPDTFFDAGIPEEERRTTVEALCEAYRCQALLAGRLTRTRAGMHLELRLFLPGVSGHDAFAADLRSPMDSPQALSAIDENPASPAVLSMADLPGIPRPVVIRGSGDPEGPAIGDRVDSVAGKAVVSAAEGTRLLGEHAGGELVFRRGGESRTWIIPRSVAPSLVPYSGPDASYRRRVLLFRQAAHMGEGTSSPEVFAARLNLAFTWLCLGRAHDALEAVRDIDDSEIPSGRTAALAYLRAVALARTGKPDLARELATVAIADSGATLDGLGEIPVQPLAKDLMDQLPAPAVPLPPAPQEPTNPAPGPQPSRMPLPGDPGW